MTEAVVSSGTPTLKEIELSKCDIHPLFKNMRFDCAEDIEKLCELIHINGQQLPGIVVPVPGNEGYYWSTIGNRRLLACKMSMEKYGTPETFLAMIKEDLIDQDIVIKKYVENFSEDGGGRKDLSFLEEASSLSEMISRFPTEFRKKVAIGMNATEEAIQRKVDLFKRLDPAMVADLHRLERHVVPPFYFTYEHVESLISLHLGREATLKIAALVAERRASPSFVDAYALALDTGKVGEPEWLYTIFPDIERRREEEKKKDKISQMKEVATAPSSNSAFLKNAVSVGCFHCGFENPLKSTLKGTVSFLNPSDPIHKESMEPISYLLPPKVCWNCHKPFSIIVHGRTKIKSIPPVEENDEYAGEELAGTFESKLGLIDFDQDAAECKEGCLLCHWIFATMKGRFKLDHATGRFTVNAQ
ncbi:MAG TPA: ParB N-terminal domain-containing protein [Nitrososphaerales archaeon]|nr:ParB N-terminal domain-containing protein [Nitrososphaerales archaeon]